MSATDIIKWIPLGAIALVALLYAVLSLTAETDERPGPPPPMPGPYSDFQVPTNTAPTQSDRIGTDIFADHPLSTVESSEPQSSPEEDDLV